MLPAVSALLVRGARARAPDAEECDPHQPAQASRTRAPGAPGLPSGRWTSTGSTANGIDFAYLCEGPRDGPLALCLHGFPDTAHTWRHLLPRLAEAGYHAVAPFLRGYAPIGVPADGRYDTGTLALDACAARTRPWAAGAMRSSSATTGVRFATYGAAAHQPRAVAQGSDRGGRAPQASMAEGFFRFDQLRRSFYVFFFQTALGRARRVAATTTPSSTASGRTGPRATTGSWDAARVKEALASPGRT